MKKALTVAGISLAAATSMAAQGPYNISIGSGDGSLAFSQIYSDGHVVGDDGLFDPAGAVGPANTVFRNYFMIHNVTDNDTYWADNVAAHTPKVPDGTVNTSASGITNSQIQFNNNLLGGLGITLAQPVPGESAGVQFSWVFANLGSATKTIRMIWFLDVDCYLDTNAYDDDMVVRLANTYIGSSGSALALGQGTANSSVNGTLGVKMDTNVPATAVYGISDNLGSTYYWQNSNNFAGLGPEVTKSIPPSIANTIQNDGDNNAAANTGDDVGGAIQVDVDIPPGGTPFLVFQAVWGTNTTYTAGSSVNDWNLY